MWYIVIYIFIGDIGILVMFPPQLSPNHLGQRRHRRLALVALHPPPPLGHPAALKSVFQDRRFLMAPQLQNRIPEHEH
jgi:hypothetical protein